jgi:hypothetical protein
MELEDALREINAKCGGSSWDVLLVLSPAIVPGGGRAVHPISWRNEYGGLKLDQVKRLKELEAENFRLRRAISDLTLDKLIPGPKSSQSGQLVSDRVR